MNCWKCGTEIEPVAGTLKIMKADACPSCDSELHVCRNCRFYDPYAHNECKEPQVEWVRDKEKANYCDYFEPTAIAKFAERRGSSASAKSAFNKLFKD